MSPGLGGGRRLRVRGWLTRETKARSPWLAAPLPAGRCLQGKQCAAHRSPAPRRGHTRGRSPGSLLPMATGRSSPPSSLRGCRRGSPGKSEPRWESRELNPAATANARGPGAKARSSDGTAPSVPTAAPLQPPGYLWRGAPVPRQLDPGGGGGVTGSGRGQWDRRRGPTPANGRRPRAAAGAGRGVGSGHRPHAAARAAAASARPAGAAPAAPHSRCNRGDARPRQQTRPRGRAGGGCTCREPPGAAPSSAGNGASAERERAGAKFKSTKFPTK